jgi:hypothetical protein
VTTSFRGMDWSGPDFVTHSMDLDVFQIVTAVGGIVLFFTPIGIAFWLLPNPKARTSRKLDREPSSRAAHF